MSVVNQTRTVRFRFLHRPALVACLGITLTLISETARCEGEDVTTIAPALKTHCSGCHNSDSTNGGLDISELLAAKNSVGRIADWVKVENAISKGKMPPAEAEPLSPDSRKTFDKWFEQQFVMPGGVQHAGPSHPRRLTREELQNTLEDILHVDIRQTVTNSRLHVIPDTVIEKFFTTGVIGESGFSNDAVTLGKESIDVQTYARCFSLILSLIDSNEEARIQLFGTADLGSSVASEQAESIIRKFATAAFRREVKTDELAAFVAVYEKMAKTNSPIEALKSSFLAILLSPSFLFRFEEPVSGPAPVVGHELATRISYFLWSSPPDKELLALAANGRLREPDIIRAQVKRMLADPRRVALAENLGGEWFDYKKLRQQSSVNKRSDRMAGFYRTQFEEALLFFDSVIRFNQPIFSLVDADWVYINPHQAGIYKLSTQSMKFAAESLPPINIHYRDFTRTIAQGNYEYKHAPLGLVKLADRNVGGFVSLGPTMSVTSTENRTSPIRRGVYVMERILGEHFEVPDDVPDLESTQKKAAKQNLKLSHKEILKLHSSQPGCASCHQYIDPIGFGLEMFDQLGIKQAVATLNPGGEQLHWNPKLTHRKYADQSWTLKRPLKSEVEYQVYFQYQQGRHRLNIRNVRLQSGDVMLVDKHFGFTGNAQQNNVWRFSIPKNSPQSGWVLTAEIEGDGGNDSHGVISIAGPDDKGEGYKLPNGHEFSTPAELKQLLLADYRDQIIGNAVKRVLAYAIGRKVLPIDRPAIQEIKRSLQEDEYRMTTLIEAVVLSYPFRHKEN